MEFTNTDFNIGRIATSGQCFRISHTDTTNYQVIHGTHQLTVTSDSTTDRHLLDCTSLEFEEVWRPYFDLEEDYAAIRAHIDPADSFLRAAVDYGQGIRILRQNLWEVMVGFIISQNNNIPRITKSIDQICSIFGEPFDKTNPTSSNQDVAQSLYAFPSAEKLTDESQLACLGLGYRTPYVAHLAQKVVSGTIDLSALQDPRDHELAHETLLGIEGVGPKVAACIELFGLHHLEACPLDTWMHKVIDGHYEGTFDWSRYRGLEGLIQQYLFFYARSLGTRVSTADTSHRTR